MRTLVVEDDVAVVDALRDSFQNSSLNIDYATDGESALKKIPDVDLLVTDLRLPGMDGTELLNEARRRKPELEVVIMTAYGSIPSAVEAMRREPEPISQNLLIRKSSLFTSEPLKKR